MRDYKEELKGDLGLIRQSEYNVTLVEANPEKGFSYSYYIYIPNEPQATMIMDCLNDYEDEMQEGKTENFEGLEEVFSLFENGEIVRSNLHNQDGLTEEKSQTLNRLYYRMVKGLNSLGTMVRINPNMPAIVPLIPGYENEQFGCVFSQLDKDVIRDIAPQIKAIIEDAKEVVEERTGVKMSDKIISLGHSKSSTFANNFSAYYPEICEASMLGGGELGTLPIDKIALKIVSDNEITQNEEFLLSNGTVTKRITQKDLERIMQEYNVTKRDYQDEITMNEDGTYNLPLNFPIGIADIEHYRDLSYFPGGKEEYRRTLANVPKMIFMGEQEETRPGHFAYKDGITKDGIEVKAGDDIHFLEKRLGHSVVEIEVASMHNRVLEYISASNILFGRSTNERLNSYMQLNKLLDIPAQSKIYKGVGHANYEYSDDVEEIDSISSKSIYVSQKLIEDIARYYNGVVTGNIPILDDYGRASRISPVPQIIRRYIASGKDLHVLSGKTEELIRTAIDSYTSSLSSKNIDRTYDELSVDEIETIFKTVEKSRLELNEKSSSENRDTKDDLSELLDNSEMSYREVREAMKNTEELNRQELELMEREGRRLSEQEQEQLREMREKAERDSRESGHRDND